jgi:hypothetical protein
MASYIRLGTSFDGKYCNPTSQQKSVYNFYESRHSREADDIYSREWFERTWSFLKQYSTSPNQKPKALESWEMVEDTDFGAFFVAKPVAGFSLWCVMQEFYELDRAVCGSDEVGLGIVKEWENWRPFVYLKSKEVKKRWRKWLEKLRREIERKNLVGEPLLLRLYDIFCGVERLERAMERLEINFGVELEGMMFMEEMVEKVRRVVTGRRAIVGDLLKFEGEEEVESESEEF